MQMGIAVPRRTATEALLDGAGRTVEPRVARLRAAPRLQVAVVACMDARLMVDDLLGLRPGDAHVIRNAGGIITDDVLRSLAISQRRLGTREVVVIRHTDCGMLGFDDGAFIEEVASAAGARPAWPAGGFPDVEQALREALGDLSENRFLVHRDRIRGFVYDVDSGALDEVRSAPS